jgi:hypothetical protein
VRQASDCLIGRIGRDLSDLSDLAIWQLRDFAVLESAAMSKHGKMARLGLIGHDLAVA